MTPPSLALIVCTRDRADRLPRTLAALAALRAHLPWELVLVDNGSRDHTPALLAHFAATADRAPETPGALLRVTVVREPHPGLARARNAGVRATRASLLCFTDDDCYPAPDFLDRWAEVFEDPAVGYGGGRILLHDPADYPITIQPSRQPDARAPYAYMAAGLIQGANMAFRREVICGLGGFDPDFGPGTPFNCEDVDMVARAAASGAAGGYFPGPVVAHHHGRRAGPAVDALERSYDHGRGAYHATLLLRAGERRHALWAWAELVNATLAHAHDWRTWRRAGREARGAAHYLAHRVAGAIRVRRGTMVPRRTRTLASDRDAALHRADP